MSMVSATHPRQVAKETVQAKAVGELVNTTILRRMGYDFPGQPRLADDPNESEKDIKILSEMLVKSNTFWKPALGQWVVTIGDIEYLSEKC